MMCKDMTVIDWYDWIDDETSEAREARRRSGCPQLSAVLLESLYQLRKTVSDGYVISKVERDILVRMGLVDRLNGWQFITRRGMAVLDVYGLLHDDRYGTSEQVAGQSTHLHRTDFVRLREEGLLLG